MNHLHLDGPATDMPMVSSQESLCDPPMPMEQDASVDGGPEQGRVLSWQDCAHWVSSIPLRHANVLQRTPEYRDLLHSLHRLEIAHHRLVREDRSTTLAQLGDVGDEVLHFILSFLDAQSLVRITLTCTRFARFVPVHAARRARPKFGQAGQRRLTSALQLVRAAEQLEGIFPYHPAVRMPSLLLDKRVLLKDAGDDDFNGVYFCTGCNGNGFVFTKPIASLPPLTKPAIRTAKANVETHSERREEPAGYRLRCIISRRFSRETLLWYCCKEELLCAISDDGEDASDASGRDEELPLKITQRYVFWARLTLLGEAPCRDQSEYPSQTAVLLAQGTTGWQSLSNAQHIHPPTVELID